MRSRDPRIALRDALDAAVWLDDATEGVTLEQFEHDELFRSAVERKLEIVGEALSRALRADGAIEDVITDTRRIIGLRNVLAHGYDVLDAEELHLIVTTQLQSLIERLRVLLSAGESE